MTDRPDPTPTDADRKEAAELLPCLCGASGKKIRFDVGDHQLMCPARRRPAVALALAKARAGANEWEELLEDCAGAMRQRGEALEEASKWRERHDTLRAELRTLMLALSSMQAAIEEFDESRLCTINERLQPVADAVVVRVNTLSAENARLRAALELALPQLSRAWARNDAVKDWPVNRRIDFKDARTAVSAAIAGGDTDG